MLEAKRDSTETFNAEIFNKTPLMTAFIVSTKRSYILGKPADLVTFTEENTVKSQIKAHADIGPHEHMPIKKDLSLYISLESIFEILRYCWKTSCFVLHMIRELHMTPKQVY